MDIKWPIPVAALLLGLQVRFLPGAWISASCRVLAGRGLCDGLISRPHQFYRVYMCVSVLECDQVKK